MNSSIARPNVRDCHGVKLLKEVLRSQARAHQNAGEFTRVSGNSSNLSPVRRRKESAKAGPREATNDKDDRYPNSKILRKEATDEWADGSELEGARKIEELCDKLRTAESQMPPPPRAVYPANEEFVFLDTTKDPSIREREAERATAEFIARHHRWELTDEFLLRLSNTKSLQDRLDIVTPSKPYHHNLRLLHSHLLKKDEEAFRRALWAPPPVEEPKENTRQRRRSFVLDSRKRINICKELDKTLSPLSRALPDTLSKSATLKLGRDRSSPAGTMRRESSAPSTLRCVVPPALELA